MKLIPLTSLFLLFTIISFGQLTVHVESVPTNTPENASIFIAGNFNAWDPGDSDFELTDDGDGTYSIVLNIDANQLLFKFTRGSWETVEGNENGQFLPDRTYSYAGGVDDLVLDILSWEDVDTGNSTAAENVSILSEDFFIPQLNRNRRIWLYLPPDYETSSKDYPVLYMHDGQNLFDAQTSFSGEWQVDESLNQLFDQGDYGIIVIGIENGGSSRIDEYSPWINPQYGGGQGDDYIDFIKNTLKPYVDENFRTLPAPEYTGIMGSSMGGLISMYGAVEHQEVFGKAGCLSTSFWFSDEVYTHVENTGREQAMKIFMLAGDLEVTSTINMVDDMNEMKETLIENGFGQEEVFTTHHSDGQHSEWYWAREFPAAYEWLFGGVVTSTDNLETDISLTIYPNPSQDYIYVKQERKESKLAKRIQLVDYNGKVIFTKKTTSNSTKINLKKIPNGLYVVKVWGTDRLLKAEKVFISK